MRTCLLLALACVGCADGSSTLTLSISADATVTSVDHFRVKVLDVGRNLDATPVDLTPSARPATLPPAQSLAVRFAASVHGRMYLIVEARDAADTLLTSGSAQVEVEPSQLLTANVVLGQVSPPVGVGGGVDMAGPDGGGQAHLTLTPATHDFGDALTNASGGSAYFLVTNDGGQSSVALTTQLAGSGASDFTLTDDYCSGQVLMPLGSCTLGVIFEPSTAGNKTANLQVSAPDLTATATLAGTALAPGALSLSPMAGEDFGSVVLATPTAAFPFTITNSASTATGTLATQLSGNDTGDFMVSSDGCAGKSIPAHGSCTVSVIFNPLMTGMRTATVTVLSSPGGAVVANLSGVGVTTASLAFSMNAAYGFPDVAVGSSSQVNLVVTNGGGQSSGSITTALTGDTGDFIVTDDCQRTTLAGGASCIISISFSPGSHGQKSLGVAVSASPGGSPSTTITGTGQDGLTLSVTPSGNGAGSITAPGGGTASAGSGINCGATCSNQYYRTTADPTVTLKATPATGSYVSGWSVAACGTGNTCQVTLSGPTDVTVSFALFSYTLTVTNTPVAGKTGVVSSPSTISCPGTCQATFDYGTIVTLGGTPSAGAYFGGWSGDCAGFGSCQLIIDGDKAVTGQFTPANIIFTTATKYSINSVAALGSGATNDAKMMSGADVACASAASGRSLPGHFVAWLSGSVPAPTRLGSSTSGNHNPRGWLRLDGLLFADDVTDLMAPNYRLYYPPSIDETGATLPIGDWVLTGTNGSGVSVDCLNWTDTLNDADSAEFGSIGGGDQDWTETGAVNCAAGDQTDFAIYCMQTDYSAYVPPPVAPTSRRTIFLSSQPWDPSTGIAAADTLCGTLAGAGGLAGNYQALLPSNGASAASRFTAHGLPVVRTDGVVVAATDTALFSAGFIPSAMIDVTEKGVTALTPVWSGAVPDFATNGSTSFTCYNGTTSWTSSAANGGTGQPGAPEDWLQAGIADTCTLSSGVGVYCLQQ